MQEDTYQGDGLNLYVYCKNNPVTYWDPSGYARKATQPSDECPPRGRFGEDDEADNDSGQKYYQVTSNEIAQELINSENPTLKGKEFQQVYVWTEQPTLKQAQNSGARYLDTVIEFETSATFSPDRSMDDSSLWSIAAISDRPGPISIYNVIEVGFKENERWWQRWKK